MSLVLNYLVNSLSPKSIDPENCIQICSVHSSSELSSFVACMQQECICLVNAV